MYKIKHCEDNGILTITLNNPDKLNALNTNTLSSLAEIFKHAKDTATIKGVLLTGTGKAFCAGADINQFVELNTQSGYQLACRGQTVFRQLETLGKPSLAAINGYAFGGGCELAMAATIRIASTNAQFGQPEVKLGLIPGYGGTQRLARLVGRGRALDLCLTGRYINAQTALNWGLITEVVELDVLIETAMRCLLNITEMAPLAVSAIIDSIDHGYNLSMPDAFHLEAMHFGSVCGSDDKNEGVAAFLEKRKPNFMGL